MEKIPNTMSLSLAWSVVTTSGLGPASMLIRVSARTAPPDHDRREIHSQCVSNRPRNDESGVSDETPAEVRRLLGYQDSNLD
jgi:hypothetical protein